MSCSTSSTRAACACSTSATTSLNERSRAPGTVHSITNPARPPVADQTSPLRLYFSQARLAGEESFNEQEAAVRQEHHWQAVQGIQRRGTSRDERARPGSEG